jgi:hypothetical protein
LFKEIAE